MRKAGVSIDITYGAMVSGRLTHVRLLGESCFGARDSLNLATQREVGMRSAAHLRAPVGGIAQDGSTPHAGAHTAPARHHSRSDRCSRAASVRLPCADPCARRLRESRCVPARLRGGQL